MSSRRRDRGQAAVVTVLFLVVLLGMAAAVLDVGSWYQEDRELQATMDASALAAAQALPDDQGEANTLATEYATKNGGGLDTVEFPASDTVKVTGSRPAPGFFSKIFGIDTVTVHATAKARVGVLTSARWVAPITVNEKHPDLPCAFKSSGCYGRETDIQLIDLHSPGGGDAAGSFGLLDLRVGGDGTAGNDEVSTWMADGLSENMPLGFYEAVPSTMFNSGQFKSALAARVGEEVLFPIYREPIRGGGSNARFDIVGWVGFHVLGFQGGGSKGKVQGWFTQIIWEGIFSDEASPEDFGARAVSLVE